GVVELEVLGLAEESRGVIRRRALALRVRLVETLRKRGRRAGLDSLEHSPFAADQVADLPGDMVLPRHGADQQLGVAEVTQVGIENVVVHAVRNENRVLGVHGYLVNANSR